MGRVTNPAANVPKATIVPMSGSVFGKDSGLNASAAIVAYRKKSYHSMTAPMTLAPTTAPIDVPVVGELLIDVLRGVRENGTVDRIMGQRASCPAKVTAVKEGVAG